MVSAWCKEKPIKKTFWPFGTSDQSRAMVVCLDALVWRLHQLHVPKAEFIKFITCYFPWSLKPSRMQKIQEFDHFHDTVFKPNSEFNLPTVLYQAPINLALEAFALCVLLLIFTYDLEQAGPGYPASTQDIKLGHSSCENKLASWLNTCQEVQWIEFYAGLGNLTKMMHASRYTSLRFDLLDNDQPKHRKSNFMDLSHPSGYAFLGPQVPK